MIHVQLEQTGYDPRCTPHVIVFHEDGIGSLDEALVRWPLNSNVGVSIDGNRLDFFVKQVEWRP